MKKARRASLSLVALLLFCSLLAGCGSVYSYSNFPPSDYEDFMAADSLGGWYNKYIKGQYPSKRLS